MLVQVHTALILHLYQCNCLFLGRNRYQLEVPDSFTAKLNGSKYVLQSQRKGYKRYYTMEIKDTVATLTEAEERRDAALKDRTRRTFAEFDTQ